MNTAVSSAGTQSKPEVSSATDAAPNLLKSVVFPPVPLQIPHSSADAGDAPGSSAPSLLPSAEFPFHQPSAGHLPTAAEAATQQLSNFNSLLQDYWRRLAMPPFVAATLPGIRPPSSQHSVTLQQALASAGLSTFPPTLASPQQPNPLGGGIWLPQQNTPQIASTPRASATSTSADSIGSLQNRSSQNPLSQHLSTAHHPLLSYSASVNGVNGGRAAAENASFMPAFAATAAAISLPVTSSSTNTSTMLSMDYMTATSFMAAAAHNTISSANNRVISASLPSLSASRQNDEEQNLLENNGCLSTASTMSCQRDDASKNVATLAAAAVATENDAKNVATAGATAEVTAAADLPPTFQIYHSQLNAPAERQELGDLSQKVMLDF